MKRFNLYTSFIIHVFLLSLIAVFVCSLYQLFFEIVIHVRVMIQTFYFLVFSMALPHHLHLVDVFEISCLNFFMIESTILLRSYRLLAL